MKRVVWWLLFVLLTLVACKTDDDDDEDSLSDMVDLLNLSFFILGGGPEEVKMRLTILLAALFVVSISSTMLRTLKAADWAVIGASVLFVTLVTNHVENVVFGTVALACAVLATTLAYFLIEGLNAIFGKNTIRLITLGITTHALYTNRHKWWGSL